MPFRVGTDRAILMALGHALATRSARCRAPRLATRSSPRALPRFARSTLVAESDPAGLNPDNGAHQMTSLGWKVEVLDEGTMTGNSLPD
jgi:hypothetical protein